MKVKVIKKCKAWDVEFWQGNQGFTLAYDATKSEALWMAKILRQAFRNYKKEILKK